MFKLNTLEEKLTCDKGDGDLTVTPPDEVCLDKDGGQHQTVTQPDECMNKDDDSTVTPHEESLDKDDELSVPPPEVCLDNDGDLTVSPPEESLDKDGDFPITPPEKSLDKDGDFPGTPSEESLDKDVDLTVSPPEESLDKDGDLTISPPEESLDKDGDFPITSPEKSLDKDDDFPGTPSEESLDKDGDLTVSPPEESMEKDGDFPVTPPEESLDKDGDFLVDSPPEVCSDKEDSADDDLMIIEEIPAKRKVPDLNMDCIDESVDVPQRVQRLKDLKVYRQTMRLLKKLSLHRRKLASKKRGTVIVTGSKDHPSSKSQLQHKPNIPRSNIRITPKQTPIRYMAPPPTIIRNNTKQYPRPPIPILRHKNGPVPGSIIVRSNGQSSSQPITTSIRPGAFVIHRQSQSQAQPQTQYQTIAPNVSLTRPIIASQTPPTTTTTNNNNQLQQMSRFVFDSNSGLLLIPQPNQGVTLALNVNMTPTITNTRSLAPSAPILRQARPALLSPRINIQSRANSIQVINNARIPLTTSIQQNTPIPRIINTTSLQQNPTVPRIVSTASLQNKTEAKKTFPKNSNQIQVKISSNNESIQKTVNQIPPIKPGVTIQTKTSSPTSNGTQMETTNIINGSSDKDPNNNRTYPSLVVVVKPCLQDKITRQMLNAARAELDTRVKSILLYSPSKLTEWLMQQGLLRLEHRCPLHMTSEGENIKYKLGMYSEGGRQPFSGGYVWISECCPDKQISVFHGSIFESTLYTPGTIMKLIYHWSCQTVSQNVLQWVKVSNYYLKNFYTLLRSACTAGLQEFSELMGGNGKYIEVGIITLGTALSQTPANQKPFKVDILGVFDPVAKTIRLKVLNPVNPNENPSRVRVQQILHPLLHWVDSNSTLLIDTSIERNYLIEMGFKSILQSKAGAIPTASNHTNVNVMNYLKNVVPKMFSTTLCVLSKSLIQQFLDELSWREKWGSTSAASFDNMIDHLVQMTKWDLGETLIQRLNKISMNPFGEWSYTQAKVPEMLSGIDMLPDSIRGMPTLQAIADYASSLIPTTSTSTSNIPNQQSQQQQHQKGKRKETLIPIDESRKRKAEDEKNDNGRTAIKKYLFKHLTDFDPSINVYTYYYAETKANRDRTATAQFPNNLKCPLCSKGFLNNTEIVRHISNHIFSLGRTSTQIFCEYCFKGIQNSAAYTQHISEYHKQDNAEFPCLICLTTYTNKTNLILHMYESHRKADMPYRCEVCDYRNSRHIELVEHFNKEHGGSDCVMCPMCLKMFSCRSAVDLHSLSQHLQNHVGRKVKKCEECVLCFGSYLDYRQHIANGSHDDPLSSIPICTLKSLEDRILNIPRPPRNKNKSNSIPPPSKKRKQQPNSNNKISQKRKDNGPALQLENIQFFIPKDEDIDEEYFCGECHKNIKNQNHFTGCFKCSKCSYGSSCELSMLMHNRYTHPLGKPKLNIGSIPTVSTNIPLIKCSCGHQTQQNNFISHLVTCGTRSGVVIGETTDSGQPPSILETDDVVGEEMPRLEAEGNFLNKLGLFPSK